MAWTMKRGRVSHRVRVPSKFKCRNGARGCRHGHRYMIMKNVISHPPHTAVDEPVVEQNARRTAALDVDHRELDIAQQSRQNEYCGDINHAGVHALDHFGRYGVHDVAHEHSGRHQCGGLAHEVEVVAVDVAPWLNTGIAVDDEVVAAFRQGQKQCEQECH